MQNLSVRLFKAINAHARQTGLELRPEYFTVAVYPATWHGYLHTRDPFEAARLNDAGTLLGFTVELDTTIPADEMELRCNWTMRI